MFCITTFEISSSCRFLLDVVVVLFAFVRFYRLSATWRRDNKRRSKPRDGPLYSGSIVRCLSVDWVQFLFNPSFRGVAAASSPRCACVRASSIVSILSIIDNLERNIKGKVTGRLLQPRRWILSRLSSRLKEGEFGGGVVDERRVLSSRRYSGSNCPHEK